MILSIMILSIMILSIMILSIIILSNNDTHHNYLKTLLSE
jgi:hypothetical protein